MKKVISLNKMVIAFFCLAVGLPLMAEETGQINYQARLLDSYGRRLNTTVNLSFKIYDAVTAGNLLWSETQADVVVQDGVYAVVLGSQTPIPASVFAQNNIYLELGINGETMSPRQQITASAYSLVARTIMGSNVYENQTSGYVGVGTTNPAVKLDVSGTIQATGFKMPTSATAGYVLASDADGFGTWQSVSVVVTEHDPIHTNWVKTVFTPATNELWNAIGLRALQSDIAAATNDMWNKPDSGTSGGINVRVLASTYNATTGALWTAVNLRALQSDVTAATNDMWNNGINQRVLKAGDKMTGLLTNLVGFVGNGEGLTNITSSGVSLTGVVHRIGGAGNEMTGPLVISNNLTVALTNDAGTTNFISLGGVAISNWNQVSGGDLTNDLANLRGATGTLNISVGNLTSTVNNADTGVAALNTATGTLNMTRVLRAGDIMTGPLTNETGYYGNGAGLTNTAWNTASNTVVYTNNANLFTAAEKATATNAIRADGSVVYTGNQDFGGKNATNISLIGFTNTTTMNCGTLGGTNGVYWNFNLTNYWILFK